MKNILVEAFVDFNFGDDAILKTFLDHYPNYNFYVLNIYKITPPKLAPNHYFIEPNQVSDSLKSLFFYKFIIIGGDMFPNYSTYEYRMKLLKMAQECYVPSYVIGCSFKKGYIEKSLQAIVDVCKLLKVIVVRDEYSYDLLNSIGVLNVYLGGDSVLNRAINMNQSVDNTLLGISVREKAFIQENLNREYCNKMAEICKLYLEEDMNNRIRFLCFSSGEVKDRSNAERIALQLNCNDRVEICEYIGDTVDFERKFANCNKIIATRFHAIILALVYNKKFLPFIYEDKNENILNDIHYSGIRLQYDDFNVKMAYDQLKYHEELYDRILFENIVEKAKLNFEIL